MRNNRRTDRLAHMLRWEKIERALAAYHQTVSTARERNNVAIAATYSDIDYRRERGLERSRT
jgi:hypothetical protein